MKYAGLLVGLGASLASAHFNLNYPTARGFDEDKLDKFPCGGQDMVSQNRTPFPIENGAIALTMGHSDSNIQVLLAIGNNPGSAFNTILKPTIHQMGLGSFCITGINIPMGSGVKEGTNATIQVQTNGDHGGGLYNCADITLHETAPLPSGIMCHNATGMSAAYATTTASPNTTGDGMSGMPPGMSMPSGMNMPSSSSDSKNSSSNSTGTGGKKSDASQAYMGPGAIGLVTVGLLSGLVALML